MGCPGGNCGSQKAVSGRIVSVSPAVEPVHRDYSESFTKQTRILSTTRKFYSITTPLVKNAPPQGWGVHVLVKGHKHSVSSSSAKGVVDGVIELYRINDVEVTPEQIWFNANIDWVSRVNIKHAYAQLNDLLALREGAAGTKIAETLSKEKEDPSPEEWGGPGWTLLGAYIASETYKRTQFVRLLKIFKDMLNDPFVGCQECADDFKVRFKKVTDDKIGSTRMEAARWMFDTMNEIRKSIGKPKFSWDEAVEKHRWEYVEEVEEKEK